jgi:hypothetical protein
MFFFFFLGVKLCLTNLDVWILGRSKELDIAISIAGNQRMENCKV